MAELQQRLSFQAQANALNTKIRDQTLDGHVSLDRRVEVWQVIRRFKTNVGIGNK
jgi:hypothetical protein